MSHGFPSASQTESAEHAEFTPLSAARGGCCCPKSHQNTEPADPPACSPVVLASSAGAKTTPGPVCTRSPVFLPKACAGVTSGEPARQQKPCVQLLDSSAFFRHFVATFRPEVQGEGSTLCASCPGELGAGTSGAGGKIHLSAGFSLDPSLDLIRHSSW